MIKVKLTPIVDVLYENESMSMKEIVETFNSSATLWARSNGIKIESHKYVDHATFATKVVLTADLTSEQHTEFLLRFA